MIVMLSGICSTGTRSPMDIEHRAAQPVILGSIYDVAITVPGSFVGEEMGDLNTRRSRIQGIKA